MQTVVAPNEDQRTGRHVEKPLSARSPLSKAEKKAIVREEYFPAAHRIGLMITVSVLTGALFVSAIVRLLPASVVAAFDWLLPSIWGAIVVQFGLRNWRYAVVAVIASSVVVIYSGLPGWSHTPILVALMAAMALFTHNRRIWVRKNGATSRRWRGQGPNQLEAMIQPVEM